MFLFLRIEWEVTFFCRVVLLGGPEKGERSRMVKFVWGKQGQLDWSHKNPFPSHDSLQIKKGFCSESHGTDAKAGPRATSKECDRDAGPFAGAMGYYHHLQGWRDGSGLGVHATFAEDLNSGPTLGSSQLPMASGSEASDTLFWTGTCTPGHTSHPHTYMHIIKNKILKKM